MSNESPVFKPADKDTSNVFWMYVLFFIWPMMAVIQSLKNLGHSYARYIIVLFFGLFSLNFVYNYKHDSMRHQESFIRISERPFADFFEIVSGLYSEEGVKPDFVMDLVAFIVSRFTAQSSIFFLALGILLGIAVMKNVKVLYALYSRQKHVIALVFLIFFLGLLSPGRILSFRHYLALAVYVLAVYQYLKEDKKYYLLFIIGSVFIHFGFLMVVPLFFIYLLAGNRNLLYYALIIASFFFADMTATLLRDYGMGNDTNLDSVVKGYTGKKYLAQVTELQGQRNVLLNNYLRWTTIYLLVVMLYHKFKYKVFDKVSENLYSFTILFFAFVNFTVGMESISNRFSIVFQALACFFFIHLYSVNQIKTAKSFKYATITVVALNIAIMVRLTFEFMNFNAVVPFLPFSLFVDSDLTMIEFINKFR
ncbi:MAG TPA: EpsG family protein [Flavobacterium sp.]|jgi:hypothetical protein